MSPYDREITVSWKEIFGPMGPTTAGERTLVRIDREVVPIVFVPGIMGSRMKRTRPGPHPKAAEVGKAWDPEAKRGWSLLTVRRGSWLYSHFFNEGALSRKAQLIGTAFDPSYLEVIGRTPAGAVDEADRPLAEATNDVPGAFLRGWAGVSQDSYGEVLRHLHDFRWWDPVGLCFDLPVHAYGYNWTDSNAESGAKLVRYLRQTVAQYAASTNREGVRRTCRRVILVTHSMGGLVARAACRQLGGDNLVLGVVHGVQPASGAPNAYWRMKGGFAESPIHLLLGKNAKEVTPLLGHMPGGLQLLPSKLFTASYGAETKSRRWLRYPAPADGRIVARPQTGNPYSEIYLERNRFFRLCDESLLDPGELLEKNPATRDVAPWALYAGHIRTAEAYHDLHQTYAHPDTVQFYGDDVTTQSRISYTRERDLAWGAEAPGVARRAYERIRYPWSQTAAAADDLDANTRGFRARVTADGMEVTPLTGPSEQVYLMTLKDASGLGDGTVPRSSGRALQLEPERTVRIDKNVEPNEDNREHEPIYNGPIARHIAAMSIENLCLGLIQDETGVGNHSSE